MKLTDDVKQRKQKHFKQYRTAQQKLTNKENLVRFLHRGKPRIIEVAKSFNQKHVVLTVDQALFPLLMELKWVVPGYKDTLTLRLGGLHTSMIFFKGIRPVHPRLWITDHLDREWHLKSTNPGACSRGQRL